MGKNTLENDVAEQKRYWEIAVGNMQDSGVPSLISDTKTANNTNLMKTYLLDESIKKLIMNVSKGSEQLIHVVLATGLISLFGLCSKEKYISLGVLPTEECKNQVLPMVIDTLRAKNFKELLLNVRSQYVNVLKYQQYDLGEVIQEFGEECKFTSMLSAVIVNRNSSAISYKDMAELTMEYTVEDKISITWSMNASEDKIDTVQEMFANILAQGLKNIEKPLVDYELIVDSEKRNLLLESYQGKETVFPRDKHVIEAFFEQAEKCPEKNAVESIYGNITYKEMLICVKRLSYLLKERGVERGSHVAVLSDRSVETVLSIYAIMQLGAAYVPIETDYPAERIRYMLQDSNCKLLLVPKTIEKVPEVQIDSIRIDRETLMSKELALCEDIPDRECPCYVIYTSGTTGRPKGVEIYNEGLVNLCCWFQKATDITEQSKLLVLNPFGFDASVKNIFTPLMIGATLVLGAELLFDTEKILEIAKHNKVTHINCVPSLFYALLDSEKEHQYESLKEIKFVILGGEALQSKPLMGWAESDLQAKILNVYGPTECTSVTTAYYVTKEEVLNNASISIGTPIDNKLVYVLTKNQKLCPVGIEGELYISGVGTATKYLSAPEGYEEAFQDNIFVPGEIMYKTGDIVKWNAQGLLEFSGRKDGQVKINGHRIELSEIESVLDRCEGVKESVVLVYKENNKKEILVAFIICDYESMTEETIKQFAMDYIPTYMIPAKIKFLKQFPHNFNGKTDKKALLSSLKIEKSVKKISHSEGTKTQIQLEEIWKELLGVEQVDYDVNFFDAGGYSLLLYKLSKAISEKFSIEVSFVDLMTYTTINKFSELIDKRKEGKEEEKQVEEKKVSAYKMRLQSLRNKQKRGSAGTSGDRN